MRGKKQNKRKWVIKSDLTPEFRHFSHQGGSVFRLGWHKKKKERVHSTLTEGLRISEKSLHGVRNLGVHS